MSFGILAALGALFSWTFGDFLIQRVVRRIGVPTVLAFVGVGASIILFPFVAHSFGSLSGHVTSIVLLSLASGAMVVASVADFTALKVGKLAIVEPILGLELPVTIALSIAFAGESPTLSQAFLMLSVFLGITLAITEHHTHLHYHKRIFEKGALIAALGAVVMGLTNFLVGYASGSIEPLLVIWCISTAVGIIFLLVLIFNPHLRARGSVIRTNIRLIIMMTLIDNAAWIFFAVATALIPIAIATTISESYIALAVLLGVFVNKEKIKRHQALGIAIAVISTILISIFTN